MPRARCPQCGDEFPTPENASEKIQQRRIHQHLRYRHGWTEEKLEEVFGAAFGGAAKGDGGD